MSAAPPATASPPAESMPVTRTTAEPVELPPDAARALAALSGCGPGPVVRLRDPGSGTIYRLSKEAVPGEEDLRLTAAELAEIQPESDWEAIQAGIADAEAGGGRPWDDVREEIWAELRATYGAAFER